MKRFQKFNRLIITSRWGCEEITGPEVWDEYERLRPEVSRDERRGDKGANLPMTDSYWKERGQYSKIRIRDEDGKLLAEIIRWRYSDNQNPWFDTVYQFICS